MSMITELVKRFRECARFQNENECVVYTADLLIEAADTIDALSEKVRGGWISVNERLPEMKYSFSDCDIYLKDKQGKIIAKGVYECFESQDVLVFYKAKNKEDSGICVASYNEWRYQDGDREIAKEWIVDAFSRGTDMYDDGGRLRTEEINAEADAGAVVSHWMPLPEPPEEVKE